MAVAARLGRTPRKDAHNGHEGEAILQHLVDFLDAFMWQADPTTLRITFVTKSARDLLGHPVSRWLSGPERWGKMIHAEDRERVIACLRATATDGIDRDCEFRAYAADGRTLVLRHAVRLLTPPSGDAELWGITTDLTGEKRVAETLRATQKRYRALSAEARKFRRQALEDGLTGLPNRMLFDDRLATALHAAQRSGEPCGVLLMDLDRFKKINDTRGHQAGDSVLREVALRFRICLRQQDTPARIGGDEFAALLPNTGEEGAVHVTERIVRAIATPILVDGRLCDIGASVGVALYPAHGSDPTELLARADQAMYRAKEGGLGLAVASPDAELSKPAMKRRRWPRGRRMVKQNALRTILGIAVAVAAFGGVVTPLGNRAVSPRTSASQLHAAVVALKDASDAEVAGVVEGVERTLTEISWTDVKRIDVVAALGRLERGLRNVSSNIPAPLDARVRHLITAIQDAERDASPKVGGGAAPDAQVGRPGSLTPGAGTP